jgi:hypothetical protein
MYSVSAFTSWQFRNPAKLLIPPGTDLHTLWAEIGLEHSFDLAMKHDEWVKKQNSHGAHFKRQLQTALILSVTFIWSPP